MLTAEEKFFHSRILFWFQEFLAMNEKQLIDYINRYNDGRLTPAQSEALDAIDQMSG